MKAGLANPRVRPPGVERPQRSVTLSDKYTATSGTVLISGIEALVRLFLDQRRLDQARGFNTSLFVSGYEGSPLGGLDVEISRQDALLSEAGVVFRPGLNEELAATAVAGTQLLGELPGRRFDGVAGFWYGKNPGFDRAADAIRHGNYSGTAPLGGAVAVVGDDPMCKSSTLPSSCELACKGLLVPLLTPATVGDVLTLGLHAVALSRYAGTWTALKVVADIADAAATVDLADPTTFVPLPDTGREAHEPILVGPQSLDAERRLLDFRLPRVGEYAHHAQLNRVHLDASRPRLAVVAPGMSFAVVLRAVADLGLDRADLEALGIRLVHIGLAWPIEARDLRRLVAGVEEVLVVEDKTAFVEAQLKESLYRQANEPVVVGRTDELGRPLLPSSGSATSELVAKVLASRLGDRLPQDAADRLARMGRRHGRIEVRSGPARPAAVAPVPARTPYFCSGCPHNISTRADAEQLVGLGIGCHIMVALDDEGRGHHVGMTQMGGEGAQWIGLAPFTDDPHYVQNMGDGTFFHSGALAVRAAVEADVRITYKLLFNHAVAMTGGQQPVGQLDVPAVVKWLALQGVRRVVVTTPDPSTYRGVRLDPVATVRHRDDMDAVQRELGAEPGVTVLIHDDWCAAEERRLRKRDLAPTPTRRVWINQRVCEGCGDCVERSTCVSLVPVETEYGRKTAVDQGSCNQDYSCVKGDCPAFVEVRGTQRHREFGDPPVPLEEPELRVDPDDVLVHLQGIGGTGVVTVSRILQMAGHLVGRHAAGVEQIGLAQKGGPVVSDVRLSAHPIEGALRAAPRSVDVLLGLDLLGTASPGTLDLCDPDRTVAVLNTGHVFTAAMVRDRESRYPVGLTERVERVARSGESALVDADWIAERLFGDHIASNVILLGAAYQHGCLPVPASAIEAAFELNGVAVGENLRAFRWGRAAVIDAQAVTVALVPNALPEPPSTLAEIVEARGADLVDYQNVSYADGFRESVARVAAIERERAPSDGLPIATAYARGLYKLMAYKDEYEVARLHLDRVESARLADEFGDGATTRVMLRPPVLTSIGLSRKIGLGSTARPTFRLLRAGRRLRGTVFDPFGRTAIRRAERRLAAEYTELVERALSSLTPQNSATVLAVAELPDLVRGYESVKQAGIARFRVRADELLCALETA
jgi:indolepyruvate ferredoxin oxidoreductase